MDYQQDLRDHSHLIHKLEFWTGKTYSELKPLIEKRAYELWIEAGRPVGFELDFWLKAEKEMLDRIRNRD
jgi:hypothetical protein